MALEHPDWVQATSDRVKMPFFQRMTATFKLKGKLKKVEIVVFHQQSNPKTSVQTMLGSLKDLGLPSLISLNAMAVYAFICLLALFFLNQMLCPKYSESELTDEVILEPMDESSMGWMHKICRVKNSFVVNLGVAFLVLTVAR